MTSSDQVAGHPIAIRVGGRRLSQSHPLRSPSKAAAQGASPSTSPEEATNIQQQPVPDYPRPQSTTKDQVKSDEEVLNTAENEGNGTEGGGGGGGGGGNRKERRRQERNKKDKYQTEEDKMHHDMMQQKSDFPFNVKNINKDSAKGSEKSKRAPSASGGGGIRITQPVSKFMT